MPNSKGLTQAYQLRDLAATEAIAFKDIPSTNDLEERRARAQSIAALIKAWESASDRVRIMRGQPLPGSRRPSSKPQRPTRRSSGLVAPPPQQPEQPPQP